VRDRFVQQAVLQVLQKRWDPTFSAHRHGFRPGHSAQQAVDLDLEKFFDRVNHDRLMAAVAGRVADKRMLKLIRAFLEAGVMEDGLVSPVEEGAPQGGPLSEGSVRTWRRKLPGALTALGGSRTRPL